MLPKRTLVLGGASSGKTAFAERLAATATGPLVYLATAEALDPEMADKIARHRRARGPRWRTVEEPRDLAGALAATGPEDCVLLDCATLWLSARLHDHPGDDAPAAAFLDALARCPGRVVTVSNELGQGVVPEHPLARRFRVLHGELNQAVAADAGLVVLVAAGLPLVLRGTLPDGLA